MINGSSVVTTRAGRLRRGALLITGASACQALALSPLVSIMTKPLVSIAFSMSTAGATAMSATATMTTGSAAEVVIG